MFKIFQSYKRKISLHFEILHDINTDLSLISNTIVNYIDKRK